MISWKRNQTVTDVRQFPLKLIFFQDLLVQQLSGFTSSCYVEMSLQLLSWESTAADLHVCSASCRSASPEDGFLILNRLGLSDL